MMYADPTFEGNLVYFFDMAELFRRDKSTISRHINKIFKEGELVREATVAFFATVQIEGGRKVSPVEEEYMKSIKVVAKEAKKQSRKKQGFAIFMRVLGKEKIWQCNASDFAP